LKILHVYKDYYPPVTGGIECHINILARGLKRKGIDVEVLVSNTKPKYSREIVDGIPITKVSQIGRFASAPINFSFPYWIRKLGKDAEIIHFHFPNPTAEFSSIFAGIQKKIVVTYHSDIIKQKNLKKMYRPFLFEFFKKSNVLLPTSDNYINTSPVLLQYRSKCIVVPLGIDLDRFEWQDNFQAPLNKIRSKYKTPIILFVGRFRYYKGLHVLIKAMRNVNATLLMVGDGDLRKDIEAQVKREKFNHKVIFLGNLTDQEIVHYYHSCDIFVLPSIERSEAFGIVQLEAMACKKPVICTRLGTGTDYVNCHKNTGLVVQANNDKALSDSINFLLRNNDIRKEYGRNAYRRVHEHFSADKMIDKIVSIYTDLLKTRPSPAQKPISPALARPITVLRMISRMNIGGPAIHVHLLTKELDKERFHSTLVTGNISSLEGDMSYLFGPNDTPPLIIPELQRQISLKLDIQAFIRIFNLLKQQLPDIVHTHTAKAGFNARFAVIIYNLLFRRHVKLVHTFHGNVFEGYFDPISSYLFIVIERIIARFTDIIVAISESQKNDLLKNYKVGSVRKIQTILLGFNLLPFINSDDLRGRFRGQIGVDEETYLIGIIGRLVSIKNHRMFLNAARYFIKRNPGKKVKFVIIGDGELRQELERYAHRIGINQHVIFCGWVHQIPMVYADLDLLALTSKNEGTPVSIIEAMATGVPVLATDAGGVRDLLGKVESTRSDGYFQYCERGILCRKNDAAGFAMGMESLIITPKKDITEQMVKARNFVINTYSQDRLVKDIESLYVDLMTQSVPEEVELKYASSPT